MTPASRRRRTLLVVQGEGRGHLTQALAAADMLRQGGHDVAGAVVGTSARRAVPAFFQAGLGAPVETVPSPNFAAGPDGRVRLGATAWRTLRDGARYARSLDALGRALDRFEPDVVVGFYEGLLGAYALLRLPEVPVVAVGHQFLFESPAYPFAPGAPVQRVAVRAYTRLAGAGAHARLALSFYDAPDLPERRVRVAPPLLRQDLFALADRPCDGSLLVYLMEPALARDLAAWSDRHPGVRLHCFSDVPAHAHSPALTFHGLSGRHFLERMAQARGVVCTAGFESVSEAMWLGKPALMTPTPGHYEQRCNARDAAAAGAGLAADTLDLDAFLDYLRTARPDPRPFREWVARAPGRLVGAVEAAAGLPPPAGDGLPSARVVLAGPRRQPGP